MMNRITPENITALHTWQRFVFGANEAGRHGAGAAKIACELFGAWYGVGFGPMALTFGIPTKDWQIQPLELPVIAVYVNRFIAYAKIESRTHFLVTAIGCGLAGFTPEEIAPLFSEASLLENVALPQSFWDILN